MGSRLHRTSSLLHLWGAIEEGAGIVAPAVPRPGGTCAFLDRLILA